MGRYGVMASTETPKKKLIFAAVILAIIVIAGVSAYYLIWKPAAEKVIRIYMEDMVETEYLEQILPEFEEETGIKVIIEKASYEVMHEKLVTVFTSAKGYYDVIIVDNPWVAEFAEAGWLIPLDDFLQEHPELNVNDYLLSLWWTVGAYWKDNKTYMLPWYNYALALMYRTDIVSEPPTTWEDFYSLALNVTNPDEDFYGVAAQARRGYKVVEEGLNYVYGFGGNVFDEHLKPIINSTEAVEALFLYGLVVWKAAPPGAINWEFDEAFDAAQSGHAAMMITYNWMIGALNNPNKSATADKWMVAQVPGGFAVLGAWGWAIPHNSPHKDLAFQFLAWVAHPETEKKLALMGHAPTRKSTFLDSEVNSKFPYMQTLYKVVNNSLPIVPPVTVGEQIVHILGRYFSDSLLIVKDYLDGKITEDQAKSQIMSKLTAAAQEIYDIMSEEGYYTEVFTLPPPWGPG